VDCALCVSAEDLIDRAYIDLLSELPTSEDGS